MNKQLQSFRNLVFNFSLISALNITSRVTADGATDIDHIFSVYFIGTKFENRIIKSHISDF